MLTNTEQWGGRVVLTLAHVAGMIDLVALPVWVGTALIGQYHLSPPIAGGLVTGYLASAVAASLIFAPRFNRLSARHTAPVAFGAAALCFVGLSLTVQISIMFALHLLAGFSAGAGLSFIHGTIGRSVRPHRLFAIVSTGLGLIGIVFLATAQWLIPRHGGQVVFGMFAAIMALAACATAVAYPQLHHEEVKKSATTEGRPNPVAARVWLPITAITLMAVTQSMTFSFLERIGTLRGFGSGVEVVLVALAVTNLIVPALSGIYERRVHALRLALVGSLGQAILVVILVFSNGFIPYALAGTSFVGTMIVTHIFVFGWLAFNDDSGRATALTPAMLMSGAAMGPLLGGLLVVNFGIASLGVVAALVGVIAFGCFHRALRR